MNRWLAIARSARCADVAESGASEERRAMQGLQISLLGPGRLELDGQALTRLLAPKHQALVFVLAAEGRALPRQRLATLLWGELDEAAARGNLRGALTRLRRWLPDVLAADAQQVGFADPAAVQIDWHLLQRAQDAARPHAERVAAAEAWRGPLLDGFDVGGAEAFEEWLATTRRRATQAVVALRHDLLARAEAAGGSDEAMSHARALLDIDDADESAHMALMRLLAGAQRRTAAIAQYEACRAALAQRLGARPSAACYALYTRIHADAVPAVRPEAAGALPPPSLPVAAETPATVLHLPPPPPPPPPPPAPATTLVGRESELALIAQRLAEPACRWLTLIGPGGVGKTRLALAAAEAHARSQRHGALVLSGRDDAAGGTLRDAQTLLQAVLARVGSDRHAPGALLLVLDNLETVPAAHGFEPLLRERAPGVMVLATSRMRVGGGREWLLELEGLSLERADPARAASSPAADLLQAAARRLAPRFDVAAEAKAVERICALVGGLPLALEMAARGVHTAGAAAVAERIAAGVPLADTDRDDHHHSIDAVMQDAWALLDAPTQEAALRLAQLPAAFDGALASAVGVSTELLATLRDRAWLTRGDGASGAAGWLALHPLQQAWLVRRAGPAKAAEVMVALHEALAASLPVVAPLADLEPDTPLASLAASAAASPPLLAAATRHACAHDDIGELARWIDGAVALLHHRGRQAEAAALLAEVLARADLPRWRSAAWRLRRAEMLDGNGQATAAQRERRGGLVALGLPDVAAEDAGWVDVLHARTALRQRRDWPPAGPEREAFGALLVRQCVFSANALSFLPDPMPVMRAGALADAACRASGAAAPMHNIVAAWGCTSLGHPRLARWFAHRARLPRQPSMPPRNAALLASGRVAIRLIGGAWSGLAADLDAVTAQYQHLGAGRQEMELRSLAAKLAFYEGRLAEAWERFAQMSELALQRPGESWRAWGPLGQCEVGLCLAGTDEALLQRLLERSTQLLSEMENVDAAYVLRRHGVAARLAWRRGDIALAREAVRAGAAAGARTRLFGFWAHEGLASLGDVLGLLRGQLPTRQEPTGPLDAAWASLTLALDAHVRRFPPAASMRARVVGMQAVAEKRADAGRRLLEQAVTLAERQGAPVDLARALEALGSLQPGVTDDAAPGRRAERLWQSMGAIAASRLRA
jgi:DNA-binding SARP family transcriptional activator